jgi:hypothetical protein
MKNPVKSAVPIHVAASPNDLEKNAPLADISANAGSGAYSSGICCHTARGMSRSLATGFAFASSMILFLQPKNKLPCFSEPYLYLAPINENATRKLRGN